MPALRKPGHELVAQALAAGKSQADAYRAGGYAYQPANAHRLCTNPAISARVNEIVAKRCEDEQRARAIATKKAGLDESWIIERAKYAVELALRGDPVLSANGRPTGEFKGRRNLGAAINGLRLLSDFKGMRIQRHEIAGPHDFTRLTDAQLDAELVATADQLGLARETIQPLLLTKRENVE